MHQRVSVTAGQRSFTSGDMSVKTAENLHSGLEGGRYLTTLIFHLIFPLLANMGSLKWPFSTVEAYSSTSWKGTLLR